MLSILIPSYNADCTTLINTLYKQATAQNVPFEILLGDDASDEKFRKANERLDQQGVCKYLRLDKNIGPAKMRNYLVKQAQYTYLLFIDTDTVPVNDDFIALYLKNAAKHSAVCGGFTYQGLPIPKDSILRYKYGVAVEETTAAQRRKHPYHSFISMNFLIDKACFRQINFDESFHLGYEDTLFGMHMHHAGISINHIDNPVYHRVEETSERFLVKIERAVNNLRGHEEEMRPFVRLLQWHSHIKRMRMQRVVSIVFRQTKGLIKTQLKSKYPNLYLFAFYKLGYLCMINESEN